MYEKAYFGRQKKAKQEKQKNIAFFLVDNHIFFITLFFPQPQPQPSGKIMEIVNNRKAKFEYHISETIEAGIVLVGTEVKSLRQKNVSINEAYAKIHNGEVFVVGMNISPYAMANRFNHDPLKDRKLLLHKKEIKRLTGKLKERGFTLVPLKMYFKNGKVKVLLGLGKGKAKYDKRKAIQKRDLDRELQREWKNR